MVAFASPTTFEQLAEERDALVTWLAGEFPRSLTLEDAEDIVSDALPALAGDPQLPPRGRRRGSYLRSALRRDAIDELRHRHGRNLRDGPREFVPLGRAGAVPGVAPEDHIEEAQSRAHYRAAVERAMARLESGDAELLRLRYLEQRAPAEIAAELGLSRTQYERRLARAGQHGFAALTAAESSPTCGPVRQLLRTGRFRTRDDVARVDVHLLDCLHCRAFAARTRSLLEVIGLPIMATCERIAARVGSLFGRGGDAAAREAHDVAIAGGTAVGAGTALTVGVGTKVAVSCAGVAIAAVCAAPLVSEFAPKPAPTTPSQQASSEQRTSKPRAAKATSTPSVIVTTAAATATPTPTPPTTSKEPAKKSTERKLNSAGAQAARPRGHRARVRARVGQASRHRLEQRDGVLRIEQRSLQRSASPTPAGADSRTESPEELVLQRGVPAVRRGVRTGAILAAGLFAGLGFASSSLAGTATVYQCVGPGGQLAATDLLRPPDPARMTVSVRCGDPAKPWGIQLTRGGSGNWEPSTSGELLVAGPAGTSVVGGQIERQIFGYVFSTDVTQYTWGFGYRLTDAAGNMIERCGSAWEDSNHPPRTCGPVPGGLWQFPSTTVALPPMSTPYLRIGYGCYEQGGKCQRPLTDESLGIRGITLRVADAEAPTVRGAVGPLAGDDPVRTRSLSINASDTGLGLYRLLVSVDGQLSESQHFDPSAAACRDADKSTPNAYEFNSASACPTGSSSRSFSLSSLPTSGQHHVRVDVEDASGNRTAAIDRVTTFDLPADGLRCPSEGCVHAPPQPNGVNASAAARLAISGKRTVRVAYGRAATISGRLVNASGAPITGAQLDVSERSSGASASVAAGQIQTDANGRFRYPIRGGPSRVVGLQYRSTLGDGPVGAQAQVSVRVRAGVTMRLRPATVNPGGSVRVRGRLLGTGAMSGALVELQALDGREWRTFKTLPVRGGRFAYRYRFRHTSGGAQFLWRIYVRAQAGLPYAAGASRAAWVTVRP